MKSLEGVLCPGGFGNRGIEGKALAARFCRKSRKPYFGICLGMQTAVIDFCRDVMGLTGADSEEFNSNAEPLACVNMPEASVERMGGTMRLGNRTTDIVDTTSLAYQLYDSNSSIVERHRHRYEVNPALVPSMEEQGLKFVGQAGERMEIAELEGHPFFLCTQFHPEFTSRPFKPNPCFLGFVLASKGLLVERLKRNHGKLLSGESFRGNSRVE